MMAFELGRPLGIPVRVRPSFLLLLLIVFLTSSGLGGLGIVLLTFASVLVHEFGHALVARQLGVRIAAIDLHFLGGAAQMIDVPRRPGDEIAIAAAGPAVSLALAGFGLGLGGALGVSILVTLGWINLILGLFNLLPAFPLDGGRILRAALVRRLGRWRGTELAVQLGRALAVGMGVVGLVWGPLQLLLIAVLIWQTSGAERRLLGSEGRIAVYRI